MPGYFRFPKRNMSWKLGEICRDPGLGRWQRMAESILCWPDLVVLDLGPLRFNLTHVVVFSMLIGMLCMLHHPAQDRLGHVIISQDLRRVRTQKEQPWETSTTKREVRAEGGQ